MRNRAKCKKCETIIESLHTHDYVVCKCGEIGVDGGQDYFRAMAKDYSNFLRIDDEGNEIVVRVVEKDEKEEKNEEQTQEATQPSREDLLNFLDAMAKDIERLPQSAMSLPITHYDHYSLIILVSSIFRA